MIFGGSETNVLFRRVVCYRSNEIDAQKYIELLFFINVFVLIEGLELESNENRRKWIFITLNILIYFFYGISIVYCWVKVFCKTN